MGPQLSNILHLAGTISFYCDTFSAVVSFRTIACCGEGQLSYGARGPKLNYFEESHVSWKP